MFKIINKIINKLNYIIETKNGIKNALQKKGIVVLVTDTFENYANKIREIKTNIIFNNIFINCNNEKIIGIIHNNIELEENEIVEDGTYIATIKPSNEKKNKIKTIQINTEVLDTRIMATIKNLQGTTKNEEIFDGDILDKLLNSPISELSVYCNGGTIESITYNGTSFEGTKLTADGTYVITVKPDNSSVKYSVTIIMDNVVPTLQISGSTIKRGKEYKKNLYITLKDGKGTHKFVKALLYKCNDSGKKIQTAEEATDITDIIRSEQGLQLTEEGGFMIELIDDNGNELEYTGRTYFFVI